MAKNGHKENEASPGVIARDTEIKQRASGRETELDTQQML